MNNKFDNLARLALNEINIGAYLGMAKDAVKATAKAAISPLAYARGAASLADKLAQSSGLTYGGQFSNFASGVGQLANIIQKYKTKHKKEIEGRDLKSAPYERLAQQQANGVMPRVGDSFSVVLPGKKDVYRQKYRLQVIDVYVTSPGATSLKADSTIKANVRLGGQGYRVRGSISVVSAPVEENVPFDTAVTDFGDLNATHIGLTTTKFYINDSISRVPVLTAITSRKRSGNHMIWLLMPQGTREFGIPKKKKTQSSSLTTPSTSPSVNTTQSTP